MFQKCWRHVDFCARVGYIAVFDIFTSGVVKTVTFKTETWLKFRDETETSSKTPRPRIETWSSRPRLEISKFVHFSKKKNVVITSDLHFLISGIFPTCFGCFLPANTTNKKSLNYRNFEKPFLCNIQCLETWNLRDRYRDETWNLRDRDSKMDLETSLASRPWPSLQTPSLIFTALANAKKFQLMGMSNYMHIL